MSRINYSEDETYPGQFNIWQANCRRSLQGRKGQKALLELEAALVAMPDKRLYAEVLVEPTGELCAIGALMVERKVADGLSRDEAVAVCADVDPDDTEGAAIRAGFPHLVAWKVFEMNDITLDTRRLTLEGPTTQFGYMGIGGGCGSIRVPYTPEERYELMLSWVRSELGKAAE